MAKPKKDQQQQAFPLVLLAVIALIAIVAVFAITITQKNTAGAASKRAQVAAGDQVRMDISVSRVTDLTGVQLDVQYNPQVLAYTGITEGTFLNSNGQAQTFTPEVTDTSQPGVVDDIVFARLGGGASGSGHVVSVYFTAIGSGSPGLRITNPVLADSTGRALSTRALSSTITVQ